MQIGLHAKVRILAMIGMFLFPTKQGCWVSLPFLLFIQDIDGMCSFSWGSTLLACLYHDTCISLYIRNKEIFGS